MYWGRGARADNNVYFVLITGFYSRRQFSSSRNVANLDGLSVGYGYGGTNRKFATNRPGSMSETNLLKYQSQKDGGAIPRPESALGLLQGTCSTTVLINDYFTVLLRFTFSGSIFFL